MIIDETIKILKETMAEIEGQLKEAEAEKVETERVLARVIPHLSEDLVSIFDNVGLNPGGVLVTDSKNKHDIEAIRELGFSVETAKLNQFDNKSTTTIGGVPIVVYWANYAPCRGECEEMIKERSHEDKDQYCSNCWKKKLRDERKLISDRGW